MQWDGVPYDFNNPDIQGVQDFPLPYINPNSNKTIQVFMGSYWLNNFVYALFTSMPDLVINVRPETLPIPFDLVTLNYVLPGMADHYGWVNRNMSMTCRITQLYINKYMPEINQVEIWGSMTVKLWLRGGNLDGTDQLAVEWNITHAFVNGTLKEATAPYFPED